MPGRSQDVPGGAIMAGGGAALVALLTIVNIFNYMDRMVLSVLAELIKKDLHLNDAELGALIGFAFVALFAAVSLPLARLADRIGHGKVLAGCIGVWSLMTAICGMTVSFWQLALARAGVGVGEAGGLPSSHALLAQAYPPEQRVIPIATVTAGAAFGSMIGMALGGIVAQHYGWRATFPIIGLPGLVLAAVVAFMLRGKRVSSGGIPAAALPLSKTLRRLLGSKTYRRLVYTHVCYTFSTVGMATWMPTFFVRTHGMPVAIAGPALGVGMGLGAAVGGVIGAWVLQRSSRGTVQRCLVLSGALMLAAFPAFVGGLLMPVSWAAITLIAIYCALSGAAGAVIVTGQQGVIDSSMRAQASACSLLTAAYIGAGLGPFLIGFGSDHLAAAFGVQSLRFALLVASLAIVAAGLLLILARRTYAAEARGIA